MEHWNPINASTDLVRPGAYRGISGFLEALLVRVSVLSLAKRRKQGSTYACRLTGASCRKHRHLECAVLVPVLAHTSRVHRLHWPLALHPAP